jgi:NADH pyrophosphatase NudC (nudix superfamily)
LATGSILLGIALLVLAGLFVAQPFLRPQEEERELTEYQLLVIEKEHLLDQIQAVDFDHDTGKLPTEVHELQRARLVQQATAVLKAIDAANDESVPKATDSVDRDIEMEAAIARMRRQRSQKSAAPAIMPAPAKSVVNGHVRFCSQCGTPTDPDDKFCANCGHKLILESSTKTA